MFFFFKQKTAYEIRNCDWSSDVCSSDLLCIFAFGLLFVSPVLAFGGFYIYFKSLKEESPKIEGSSAGTSKAIDTSATAAPTVTEELEQIGRASCRERV